VVDGNIEARVRTLHAAGVQATAAGRPALGARDLRRGLHLIGWTEPPGSAAVSHPRLAARLLISLAHAEAEQGRTRKGFGLLDIASTMTDPADRGVLVQQRGLLLQRTGRNAEALRCLDAAVPLLSGTDHHAVLARTLLNRAALRIYEGLFHEARADLDRCGTVATEHGLDSLVAKVWHNRGYCDLLAGDVPAALAGFARAEALYQEQSPDFVPVVLAARARALLQVGLASEAARALDIAIPAFHDQRLSQDEAEAMLLRAQAALDSHDQVGALHWAELAARGFRRRGNEAWFALASLMRLRIEPMSDRGFADRAARLATRLNGLGLAGDAELARLLRARSLIAAGRPATTDLAGPDRPRRRPFGWLEIQLTRRLAQAELALAEGDPYRALAHAQSGLTVLQRHRSSLGSLDLMAGTAALGQQLAALGLRVAAEHGTAAKLFAWSERSRAQAFRVTPVKAPQDPVLADALAQLRQLRNVLRTAELAGRREPGLAGRCAELERVVRERSWQRAGTGSTRPDATLGALRTELGDRDRVLICYLTRGDRLTALVAGPGRSRVVDLASVATVAETARRLLADLDAVAGRALPERLDAVIRASIRRHVDQLDDALVRPIADLLGPAGLVVVPTGILAALPWAMLPGLRGRSVTVAPSATAWLNAARVADEAPGASAGPLLVAGPHLMHAEAELDGIAKLHPDHQVLRGELATVTAALTGLEGAPMAHFAAHGHHEPDNGLFSRLDLADGPLMVYDMQQVGNLPRLITLSACDVGRAVVAPGDEHLGFTAALLYAGTACVVSSVCRVVHDTAATVMTAVHRALAGGASPAQALAMASVDEPLATFVCFGAG
jgi:hypothetical protein